MQDWGAQVTAAQQGDLTAFTAVVRRFEDMAVGYAYSLLGDRDAAQDAAQEAFIEAYLCLKGLRQPYGFPAWLRRIVLKQCDRVTRVKRPETVPLEAATGLSTEEPGPAEALERQEVRQAVLSAVRSLPEHERTTTTLFYINGYSLAEIGDFLEVPVGTVKRRLHSARQKLRERMVGPVEETLKQQAPDEGFDRRVARVLERGSAMLKPYIVERGMIRIIGRRRQIGPGPEKGEIAELWQDHRELLAAVPNRVDGLLYGISIDFWHPNRKNDAGDEGLRSYMIGLEVSSLAELPLDLESKVIPASHWLYIPMTYSDPDVKALAPEEYQNDLGYLTGCVFGYASRWIGANGYERQDFPDELEIFGLDNGGQCTIAVAIHAPGNHH